MAEEDFYLKTHNDEIQKLMKQKEDLEKELTLSMEIWEEAMKKSLE
ncbi:MAG: hypothetical protein HWD61_01715 [Parachlamydiaceae bacterium]|nr:MAG: hypothetical protein HWD61_01715 [Parachlamydiaceae bacterium]